MSALPDAPFGRLLTAMVTPFTDNGEVDYEGAATLADHLVTAGCTGLVISGTTGESATTSDEEKEQLVGVVVDAVGDRVPVIAGVGTNDTRHSLELCVSAAKAGAAGLLAVTPYYTKPPQAGLLAHFQQIGDATDLPVMLYDIPGRTGLAIETETLVRLAEHPRILAVKACGKVRVGELDQITLVDERIDSVLGGERRARHGQVGPRRHQPRATRQRLAGAP